MVVDIRTLRVSIDGDSSGYVKAMNDKVAAEKSAIASNAALAQSTQLSEAAILQSSQRISSASDGIERLKRSLIAGYSASQDFDRGLTNISRGLDKGRISSDQAAAALEGLYRRYGQVAEASKLIASGQVELAKAAELANSRIQAQQKLQPANNNANHYRALDVAYQAQDSITQAFGGSSPTTIGLQQGPQLAGAFAGQTSKEALSTLGTGLLSLISPVNLLSIGFVTLGAAGIQALQKIHGETKTLADALKDEEDAINRIAKAYGGVADQAAKAGISESRRLADALGSRSTAALQISATAESQNYFANSDIGHFARGFVSSTPQFQDALVKLRNDAKAGKADFDTFYDAIAQKVALDPSLAQAGNKIITESEKFKQATDTLKEYQRIREALQGGNQRGFIIGSPGEQDYFDYTSTEQKALDEAKARQDAQIAALNARTPEQRIAAARQTAIAQPVAGETGREAQQRADLAEQMARAQESKQLADAQRDRQLNLQKTLSDQQLEIQLIGKTSSETAALRLQYQLTGQLRQDAAKNGTQVDQSEIELIKQKSAELGKLTDAYNKAKLANDLSFERDQIFRSPQEQQIASRLQSAGQPIDLNSQQANLIRQNLQLSSLKDGVTSFFTDFRQALVSNGGKVGDAFGTSLRNAALNALTKIGDDAANTLSNMIVHLLTGTSGGATGASSIASSSGGLLGMIFGGGNSGTGVGALSPANNNSPGAALTGAGGVQGQIWNFFASKGLQPHQIAGIMGNIGAESSFNPLATGDNGNALGLFQWNSRAPQLLSAIGGRQNLGDVNSQLNFAWNELQGPESKSLQALLASKDVGGATAAFAGFERPKGFTWANPQGADNFVGRLNGAENALGKFGNTTTQAAQGVGQFGTGLSQLSQSLSSNFFPAAPARSGGGFGGWLSSLFGGGGSFTPIGAQATKAFSGSITGLFANGTDFSPGGVAMVGENGPELVNLPRGSQVVPNHKTEAILRNASNSNDGGSSSSAPGVLHVHIDGASGDDHVRKLVQEGVRGGLFDYNEGMRRQGVGTLNARFNAQKG